MTTRTASRSQTQSTESDLITGEDFYMMNDIGSAELVEGRIASMTPAGSEHGAIEMNLAAALHAFVRDNTLGRVMVGEVGIYTRRDPDTIRGADIAFLSKERAPDGPPKGYLEVAPELVVEIVSPGNTWIEMRRKIDEYFDAGVDRVWIVEPETTSVLVYQDSTTMEKYEAGDVVSGEGPLDGFEIPVDEIFAV